MKRDDLLEAVKNDKDARENEVMNRPAPDGKMVGGGGDGMAGGGAPTAVGQGGQQDPSQIPAQQVAQQANTQQGGNLSGNIGGREIFDMISNRAFGVRPYASINARNIAERRDSREQAVFEFNQRSARKTERMGDASREIAPKLQAIANPSSYYYNNLNHLQDVLNKNMDFFGGEYEITDAGEKQGEEKLWNITIKDPSTGEVISKMKETTTGAIDSFNAVMSPEEQFAMRNEINKTYMKQRQTLKTARSMVNASVIEKRIFGIPTTKLEESMYNFDQLEKEMPESPLWMRREASGMGEFFPDQYDYIGGGPVKDSSGKWGLMAKDRSDDNTVKIVPIKGLTGDDGTGSTAATKNANEMKLKQAKYFREGVEGYATKEVPAGVGGGVKSVVDPEKREWMNRIYDARNPNVSKAGFSGTNPEFRKIDKELSLISGIYDTATLRLRDEMAARMGEGENAIDQETMIQAFGSVENYEQYVLGRHISDLVQGIVRPKLTDSPQAHIEYLQKLPPDERGLYLSLLPEKVYGAVKYAFDEAVKPKPKRVGGEKPLGYAPRGTEISVNAGQRRSKPTRMPGIGGMLGAEDAGTFEEALKKEQEKVNIGGAGKKKKEEFRGL